MWQQSKDLARAFKRELAVYRRVLADDRTPLSAKIFLGLAIGYLCMPFDLIPDFIPDLWPLGRCFYCPRAGLYHATACSTRTGRGAPDGGDTQSRSEPSFSCSHANHLTARWSRPRAAVLFSLTCVQPANPQPDVSPLVSGSILFSLGDFPKRIVRKQYYFRPSNRGFAAWDVDRLVRLSRDLPRIQVPIRLIRELDEPFWFGSGSDAATCRAISGARTSDRRRRLELPDYPLLGRARHGRYASSCQGGIARPRDDRCGAVCHDVKHHLVDVQPEDLPYEDTFNEASRIA